jgi:hypothetical protein
MTTETITWTLSNGAEATVTVDLERVIRHLGTCDTTGKVYTRDEGLRLLVEGCANGEVLGNHYSEDGVPESYRAAGVVGTVGRLAVKANEAEQIKAAIERAKSAPEYVAQMAARAKADAEYNNYVAHKRRIERTA